MRATKNKPVPGTRGRINVNVWAELPGGGTAPVVRAHLLLIKDDFVDATGRWVEPTEDQLKSPSLVVLGQAHTGPGGQAAFDNLPFDKYLVLYNHVTPFEKRASWKICKQAAVDANDWQGTAEFVLHPGVELQELFYSNGARQDKREHGLVGDTMWIWTLYKNLDGAPRPASSDDDYAPLEGMRAMPEAPLQMADEKGFKSRTILAAVGSIEPAARILMQTRGLAGRSPGEEAFFRISDTVFVDGSSPLPVNGDITTHAARTEAEFRPAIAHWTLIRNSTEALSFNNYKQFLDHLFCEEGGSKTPEGRAFRSLEKRRFLPFNDTDSYRVLKAATEAYVMVNCGVLSEPWDFRAVDDADYLDRRDLPHDKVLADELLHRYLADADPDIKTLPYLALIRSKLPDVRIHIDHERAHEVELCAGFIRDRLQNPCLMELIWSYWQEEGMLVQSMNAITRRFQNVRSNANGSGQDPLANMEIDMLRPLNNLLWGYVQDEQHRLTVVRRNYEYDHHYGIRLDGKAVRNFHPADSRSKFIEAFHNLLRQLMPFYRQDDDTTVKADAFPILNALKEVHLILSQGAHNQYGDLPSTSRIEMLMQQWMLARPEFREFLPTRLMVAHPEPWMDRVDAMKKVQGWSDTSVAHFRDLAMFGEMLLLSIRTTHWTDMYEPNDAFAWARFWRPQAQGYMHAYRAVTGVDLTAEVANPKLEATMPSELLRQRLEGQQRVA